MGQKEMELEIELLDMKNNSKFISIMIIFIIGCSPFKMGNISINSPNEVMKGKSFFFLAYLKGYPIDNFGNNSVSPKGFREKKRVLLIPVTILDCFYSKENFKSMSIDDYQIEFENWFMEEKGYTNEFLKSEKIKQINRFKYVYLDYKSNSEKKKVISIFKNKKLVLLRADYSYLANDTSIFIRNLYLPNEKIFEKYLEEFKP